MAETKKVYIIKYEKKNGSITQTRRTATSKQEAKSMQLMSSDTKRVITVMEA